MDTIHLQMRVEVVQVEAGLVDDDVHGPFLGGPGVVGVYHQCGCQICVLLVPSEDAFQEGRDWEEVGRGQKDCRGEAVREAAVQHEEVHHEEDHHEEDHEVVVVSLVHVPLVDDPQVEVRGHTGSMQGSRIYSRPLTGRIWIQVVFHRKCH